MIKFIFSKEAKKSFEKLPTKIQKRILIKLGLLQRYTNIFSITKKLVNLEPASHRLRIGSYRVVLELKLHTKADTKFLILEINHRKEVYKR